ncbi:MAG TPA: type VI secretion system protein TssA [Terracidiphilus sp.]|nr:type VI secretion system protein TssA [Terracidiphilus sp.]
MPLREDLLAPIAGENPSGADLYYDKVFGQIKEARREEEDQGPVGTLAQQKKADHRAVIKLAGEALAKKSKDLRLAGWLVESQLKVEGFPVLAPGIELLHALQETFWPTLYPVIEEGNDLELRMLAVEAAGGLITAAARNAPLTRSGLSLIDYLESRVVGYEKDATTDAKQEARKDAIEQGKLSAEDFDQAFAATPKSFYVDITAALAESLEATKRLDQYQQEAYGDNVPNLSKLREGLEEVHHVAESLLNERRKTEPDPVSVVDEPEPEEGGEAEAGAEGEPSGEPGRRRAVTSGQLSRVADAYALVVESAEFLFEKDPKSPIPYLVCAGLRLGETRMQGPAPAPGFAVGPGAEIRQSLRTLATKGAWQELLRASLPILAGECARTWLDLHRYIWRAGQETGADAVSDAVVGTVKSLLAVRPELRYWTLEDDTGAANPETQQWLDATVLQ